MRNRLWFPFALISAMCLTACGGDGNGNGNNNNGNGNNARQIDFDSVGDSETLKEGNVEIRITEVASNTVNISLTNENQADQVNITISDSVSGLILYEFLFLPPGQTASSGNIQVLSGVQLHFKVENVGTNFNPPTTCSTPSTTTTNTNNNVSCIDEVDISITF